MLSGNDIKRKLWLDARVLYVETPDGRLSDSGTLWVPFSVDYGAEQLPWECRDCGDELESGFMCLDGAEECCEDCMVEARDALQGAFDGKWSDASADRKAEPAPLAELLDRIGTEQVGTSDHGAAGAIADALEELGREDSLECRAARMIFAHGLRW
jgi:hypothetical protein